MGLDYWNGKFYTFVADSSDLSGVSYLVKFGLTPGDEVILGSYPFTHDSFAISSSGTLYLIEQFIPTPFITPIDIQTMSVGSSISVSPGFIGGDPGYWAVMDADMDAQGRLVVSTLNGVIRFNSITSAGAWEKDCDNSNLNAKPCWGPGPYISLAVDEAGIPYGCTETKIFSLNLNSNVQVVSDIRNVWVGNITGNDLPTGIWAGMTFAPRFSSCNFRKIGKAIVCF